MGGGDRRHYDDAYGDRAYLMKCFIGHLSYLRRNIRQMQAWLDEEDGVGLPGIWELHQPPTGHPLCDWLEALYDDCQTVIVRLQQSGGVVMQDESAVNLLWAGSQDLKEANAVVRAQWKEDGE